MWVGTAVWAFSIAALAVVTVQISTLAASPSASMGLYTLRHLLLGAAVVSVVWVLQAISGNWFRTLTATLVGILVLRAVLWFSTDLVWTHSVDAAGVPIYGPLRVVLVVATNLLALVIVIKILVKPWRLESARRAAWWGMIPASICALLALFLPAEATDYLMVIILSIPVLVVESVLLSGLARQYRLARVLSTRESRLAEFGRDALAVGGGVPSQAAVVLVMDVVSPKYCEYAEVIGDRRQVVASAGERPTSVDVHSVTVPVEASGKTIGELTMSGDLAEDDTVFLRGVGLILSAALGRSQMELELRDQALHDLVTGLPNWALLQDRLGGLLSRSGERMIVVLCCDITELKSVNDEYGHETGDALLREVGTRLADIADRNATVARIGADEFVLTQFVDDLASADRLSRLATTIGQEPLKSGGEVVAFDVRVGFVTTQDAAADADRLVRDAEIALMQAKATSMQRASFDQSARTAGDARRKVLRALTTAVRDDQIFVEYQPILELSTQRVVGVEALARWRNTDGELVPPLEFIPIAESTGLINEITERVFDQAFGQLAGWDRFGRDAAGLRMSLNVTPNVVGDKDFIPWLTALLDSHNVDPDRVTLELTESALERAQDDVLRNLHSVRKLGPRLSLDDFGTGYSTFDRLLTLPVGELKIDRRFTKTGTGPHRKIVPTVVDLAHRSDLVVVAEGIETQEQWSMLLADGCEFGQGYLFSRPIVGERIPEYIRRSRLRLVDDVPVEGVGG